MHLPIQFAYDHFADSTHHWELDPGSQTDIGHNQQYDH